MSLFVLPPSNAGFIIKKRGVPLTCPPDAEGFDRRHVQHCVLKGRQSGLESFSAFYDMAHTGCTGGLWSAHFEHTRTPKQLWWWK